MEDLAPYRPEAAADVIGQLEENRDLAALEDPHADRQWLFALRDLGYVDTPAIERWDASDTAGVLAGLDRYRFESAVGPGRSGRFTSVGDDARRGPTQVEREALRDVTSFDGEWTLTRVPTEGEVSVTSRIAHLRLAMLGVFQGSIASPFARQTLLQLDQLRALLQPGADRRGVLNLLGSADELQEAYLARYWPYPLVVKRTVELTRQDRYANLYCPEHGFRPVLEHQVAARFQPGNPWDSHWKSFYATRPGPAAQRMVISNLIGLQLLQLRLWMDGYYEGRLDGLFGPRSQAALVRAVRDLAERGSHYSLHDGIVAVEDGLAAINPRFVLRRVLSPRTDSNSEAQLVRSVRAELGEPATAAAPASHYTTLSSRRRKKGFVSLLGAAIKATAKAVVGAARRVYHGVRGLVRSALHGLSKGWAWLRSGIQKGLEKAAALARFVGNSVAAIARAIAEGARALVGLARGSPLETVDASGAIASRHDFDLDFTIACSRGASPLLIDAHILARRRNTATLSQALTVVAIMLRYLVRIAAGPPGWILIAIELGKDIVAALRRMARPALAG